MDLPRTISTIIAHVTRKARFYGVYKYRVESSAVAAPGETGERLNLQIVSKVDGLPDELAIKKVHGLAGADEICAPSSLVDVAFEGGDPGQPVVVHYHPTTPISITLSASGSIKLGADASRGVARLDDTVDCGTLTVAPNATPAEPAGIKVSYTPAGGLAPTFVFRLDGAITLTPITPLVPSAVISGKISTASGKVSAE